MIWDRARYALRRVATVFRSRDRDQSAARDGGHGPVFATVRKSKPAGVRTPDLTARAHRLHNRNKAAAERYLRTHAALRRGV